MVFCGVFGVREVSAVLGIGFEVFELERVRLWKPFLGRGR